MSLDRYADLPSTIPMRRGRRPDSAKPEKRERRIDAVEDRLVHRKPLAKVLSLYNISKRTYLYWQASVLAYPGKRPDAIRRAAKTG